MPIFSFASERWAFLIWIAMVFFLRVILVGLKPTNFECPLLDKGDILHGNLLEFFNSSVKHAHARSS